MRVAVTLIETWIVHIDPPVSQSRCEEWFWCCYLCQILDNEITTGQ